MSGRVLTTEQKSRAAGALVGLAIADALGAPYEFRDSLLPGSSRCRLIGQAKSGCGLSVNAFTRRGRGSREVRHRAHGEEAPRA